MWSNLAHYVNTRRSCLNNFSDQLNWDVGQLNCTLRKHCSQYSNWNSGTWLNHTMLWNKRMLTCLDLFFCKVSSSRCLTLAFIHHKHSIPMSQNWNLDTFTVFTSCKYTELKTWLSVEQSNYPPSIVYAAKWCHTLCSSSWMWRRTCYDAYLSSSDALKICLFWDSKRGAHPRRWWCKGRRCHYWSCTRDSCVSVSILVQGPLVWRWIPGFQNFLSFFSAAFESPLFPEFCWFLLPSFGSRTSRQLGFESVVQLHSCSVISFKYGETNLHLLHCFGASNLLAWLSAGLVLVSLPVSWLFDWLVDWDNYEQIKPIINTFFAWVCPTNFPLEFLHILATV